MDLSWMAWTGPTAYLFMGVGGAIALMIVLEIIWPGGAERRGVLGLTTTRGDRLFLTCLGSAFVLLAWLGLGGPAFWKDSVAGLVGLPNDEHLWGALGLALLWGGFCFWKV